MVMAEKRSPAGVWDDVKEVVEDVADLFRKEPREQEQEDKPGSALPGTGKCGCHPGGMHPMDDPMEIEQRDEIELVAIPVKVENIITVRELPAKRASMDTFYPGITMQTAMMIQGKDPRIRRLIMQSATQACWVGSETAIKQLSNAGAGTVGNGCYRVGSGAAPVTFEGIDQDLWALGVGAGAILSVRREYWPDV